MPKTNRPPGYVKVHGESLGKDCQKALEAKIIKKKIRMDVLDIDKYRRTVGIIWLGNRNINLEMVREGYAKAYDKYLKGSYRSRVPICTARSQIIKKRNLEFAPVGV